MNRNTRSAFASIMVVAILPIVGTAMLAIAMLTSSDARRTSSNEQDTQLRQLLLAGSATVLERSSRWQDLPAAETFTVALPTTIVERQALLDVTIKIDGNDVIANIQAAYQNRSANQRVRLQKQNGEWQIIEAALQ